ncbi:hypothetical protein C8Q73DRAFT_794313 [Cubamyces lactineus]|nr:hypothetical protein C8Q73DRAFT_794313 [Cubamyces lactineus]
MPTEVTSSTSATRAESAHATSFQAQTTIVTEISQSTATSTLLMEPIATSIHSQTSSHLSAAVIAASIVGSIAFLSALVLLYLYLRQRRKNRAGLREKNMYEEGAATPMAEKTLRTTSAYEVAQEAQSSASSSLVDTALVTRAADVNDHGSFLIEDRPLLRPSTTSSSSASSIACSSMSEIPESESYILKHSESIADDVDLAIEPFSVTHGETTTPERRLRTKSMSSALYTSTEYRSTVVSDDFTPSEASSLGWHPSRMVRPSLTPRRGSAIPAHQDDASELAGCRSTESYVSESLISEEMGVAM